jgi:hypothetical protein
VYFSLPFVLCPRVDLSAFCLPPLSLLSLLCSLSASYPLPIRLFLFILYASFFQHFSPSSEFTFPGSSRMPSFLPLLPHSPAPLHLITFTLFSFR